MSPLQSRPFPTPWLRTILCFVILACPSAGLADNLSDLQISEFSAEGDGSYLDEDGDPSDWIELRNTGSATINLGGYFLTDDPADPMQWQLPGVELDTGSLVVVFASGKDRAILGGELHTNFSLSAAGEYLALIAPDGTTPVCEFAPQFPRQFFGLSYGVASGGEVSEETYLETPAAASWFVPTADIGTTWRDLGFDDSQWVAAETGIGFGFGYEGFIGAGGDIDSAMRGVNPGAYIRLPFQVEDAASVVSLELSLLFEDGFAAYLNGVKVAAANTPALLAFDSTATAGGEVTAGDEPDTYDLDFAGKLISGENVLAIHLLNQTISSSDVLVVPELRGLSSDGSMVTGYMITPTPGAPNSPIDYPDYVRDTGFDVDRGFFEAPFDLTISCPTPGATLVYTTDGNSPSLSNGIAVTAPDANTPPQATIAISTTTVVRAAAFKDGLKPTNIDTQSYLFLADVLDQSDSPLPGYPLPWITRNGSAIEGDYDMDPDIVGPVYSREELEGGTRLAADDLDRHRHRQPVRPADRHPGQPAGRRRRLRAPDLRRDARLRGRARPARATPACA